MAATSTHAMQRQEPDPPMRPTHAARSSIALAARGPGRLLVVVLLLASLVAACGGSATPPPSFPAGAVVVHAKNRTFDSSQLQIPAATEFSLVLVNEDSDLHNIAIRTAADGKGELLFRFDPVSLRTVVVTAGPIPKGNYFFLCEVHPSMFGTVFAY